MTMNIFGFKISPSSAINLDKVDRSRFEKLCSIEPDAAKCMASSFSGMSLRKVLLCLQRGKESDAMKMMKNCMLCGKCSMVCPRGINTRNVLLAIWKIYKEEEA